jgi:membrane protease YdiL (CAAX protease family)
MAEQHNPLIAAIRRHPLTAFFVWFFTVGQAFAFAPLIIDTTIPQQWFINGATVFGLLLPAVVITAIIDGREGVRALGRGIVKLSGPARVYVVGFVVMPLVAIAMAVALLGAPDVPTSTWVSALATGLLVSTVVGFALNNLWEEVAWMGFVQARLQQRHSALRAALIAAPLFALQHTALLLQDDLVSTVLVFLVTLVLMATFRAFVAWIYNSTGGSLLVVGLFHAFGNAIGAGAGFGMSFLRALYPADPTVVGVLHSAAIAVVGLGIIVATRGRLGLPPGQEGRRADRSELQQGLATGSAR